MTWYSIALTTFIVLVIFFVGFSAGYSSCLIRLKGFFKVFDLYMQQVERLAKNVRKTLELEKNEKKLKELKDGIPSNPQNKN